MEREVTSFYPSPSMKKLYYTYLSVPVILTLLFVVFPLLYFLGFHLYQLAVYIPFLVFYTAFAIWIPNYYTSLSYSLEESHLLVQEGVILKKKKRIPFNQITNAAIRQGPFKQSYGIANINIQTAGRAGQRGSEATLRALQSYEEIDEKITHRIEAVRPERVEAKAGEKPKAVQEEILHELQDMKGLLKHIVESI